MADQHCYANRELSWLKFNQRVLEEAQDPANPLCERLSFLSIFQSNLDEFFMVRVGSLFEKMQVSEKIRENKTNMTCREQLLAIFERVRQMLHDKDNTYRDLQNCLKTEGVEIVDFHTISQQEDYQQKAAVPIPAKQGNLCGCCTGEKRQRKNRNRSVQQSGIPKICFPAEPEKPLYSDGRTHPALCIGYFLSPCHQEQIADSDCSECRH